MKPPSSLMTVVIAVALAGLCGCAAAHGEVRVSEVNVPFDMGSSFQPVGSASVKQEISDGGEGYWLLPTFDDRDAALENVRREGLGAGMADLPDQSTPAGSVGQGQ